MSVFLNSFKVNFPFLYLFRERTQPAITYSKLTRETLEEGEVTGVVLVFFIVNFKYISHLVLVFLSLNLSR